jgi:hypothetical protein
MHYWPSAQIALYMMKGENSLIASAGRTLNKGLLYCHVLGFNVLLPNKILINGYPTRRIFHRHAREFQRLPFRRLDVRRSRLPNMPRQNQMYQPSEEVFIFAVYW